LAYVFLLNIAAPCTRTVAGVIGSIDSTILPACVRKLNVFQFFSLLLPV